MMLMTMIGREHSSRPLTIADVSEHRLSFLIDATTEWATLDRAEVDRLWNPGAAAFFDGKDDPALAVLHLDVSDGEYWNGPSGRISAAIQMVRAALSNAPEPVGERGEIATG